MLACMLHGVQVVDVLDSRPFEGSFRLRIKCIPSSAPRTGTAGASASSSLWVSRHARDGTELLAPTPAVASSATDEGGAESELEIAAEADGGREVELASPRPESR